MILLSIRMHVRDWSLITGREAGGVLQNGREGSYKTGRGACEVLPLRKGGRAKKVLAMLKGGGCAHKVLRYFLSGRLKF